MRTGLLIFVGLAAFAKGPQYKIASIETTPGEIALNGKWDSQRILVTGRTADGSVRDVTAQTQFKSGDSRIAAVSKAGVVTPVRDGETTITLAVAGAKGKPKLRVAVKGAHVQAASFVNAVEPLLSKTGCNSAPCHGAQRGQGGLRLSLFGGDPEADFDALAKAAGGRRVNRAEPRESLVFLKVTGALPHGGQGQAGPTLKPGTPEYEMLAAWLEAGAPAAGEKEPRVAALELYPRERLLQKGDSQRLLVTAVFADGSRRDVTADAAFHSSNARVAAVSAGEVKAVGTGDAAVTAGYARKAAVLRVAVPQPGPKQFPRLEANNRIDELVYAKLKIMGIPPSVLSTDAVFLRRAYLDTIGILPTAAEARAFLSDNDPRKRSALIDHLLERDEFNDFWALKWGDLLRIKSEYPVRLWPKAVAVYYEWVRESLARNKPYDQFARELLTANGSNFRVGPANFVRAVPSKDARTLGESAALVFMGARIGCARCHSHPLESWTLDDDLALGAFFARVGFKSTTEWKEEIVYPDFRLKLIHPRTRETVQPRLLPDGQTVQVGPEEDPRGRFAAWLTAPGNPWFARNIVNRIWFWLLGKGIINEPDDIRPTNPPTNPELLAYLENELTAHQYELRHIYRLILNSRTYQLSSEPNDFNAADTSSFSHYAVKRLTAEEMLDAVSQFTETSEKFRSIIPEPYSNWPPNYHATAISDGNTECSFLDLFGRPPRDTPYEEERDSDLTLRQTLYFLNSEQLESKVAGSPSLKRLTARSDTDAVDEIYLSALSRFPAPDERKRLLDYLASKKSARSQAIQDVAWAVLNAKEFEFNH